MSSPPSYPRCLPSRIELREVGLRDALQSLDRVLPTALKCDWILMAHAAGLNAIEVGGVLPDRREGPLADTAELVAFARTVPGLSVSVYVQDLAGAQAALAMGADRLTLPVPVHEALARSTTGRSTQELLLELARIRAHRDARAPRGRIDVVLSAALGGGVGTPPDLPQVLTLAEAAVLAGADTLALGDAHGGARPQEVYAGFQAIRTGLPAGLPLGAHFHAPRGEPLGSVMAAVEAGATRFDVTLGGLGAPATTGEGPGNLDAESVARLFADIGVPTGIDLHALAELREFVGRQAAARPLWLAKARQRVTRTPT